MAETSDLKELLLLELECPVCTSSMVGSRLPQVILICRKTLEMLDFFDAGVLERPRLLLFLLPPPPLLSHLQEHQWMGQVLLKRILSLLNMMMVEVTILKM